MQYLVLAGFIVVTQAVGLLGAAVTQPGIESWYSQLNKPWFTPPNWLFGPVWTLLYILMAISAYLVWRKAGWNWSVFIWYAVQLGLNFLWSYLFFGLKSPMASFLEIIVLLISIIMLFIKFRGVFPLAGNLLIPYLVWVSFASFLNLGILLLN